MAKKTLIVQDTPITVIKQGEEDYICLTDMLQAKDGDFFVTDWLRNRNTLEYIGIWEKVYNPDFNYGEFATIRNQAGLNSFKISVKEFQRLKEEEQKAIGWSAKNEGIPQRDRLHKLNKIAIQQMTVLEEVENRKLLK